MVVAMPVLLAVGREQWFFFDEWALLLHRQELTAEALLRPHNDHWITAPVLVYQALWHLFGLHTYRPYQLVVVVLHLAAVVLLRAVARRGGSSPWIATIVALPFVVFGSGREDILWAFQMTLTGSLVFGLAHLLLADHTGPVDRRDWAGLAAGLMGLMCSALSIPLTMVVAGVVWVRRGARYAILHSAPLAVVYGAWFLAYGSSAAHSYSSVDAALRFARNGLLHAAEGLGHVPFVGFGVIVLVATGTALAWRDRGTSRDPSRLAPAIGLAMLTLVFALATGYTRGEEASPYLTRYTYLMAVPLLPLIAVSISELWQRWRLIGALAVAGVLVGVPGNFRALDPSGVEAFTLGQPRTVLIGAHLPVLRQLPADAQPFDSWNPMSAGWLLDGVASGKIPAAPASSVQERLRLTLIASLRPTRGPVGSPCLPLSATGEARAMVAGDTLSFTGGPLDVELVVPDGRGLPVTYAPDRPRLRVVAGPLQLRLRSTDADWPVSICS